MLLLLPLLLIIKRKDMDALVLLLLLAVSLYLIIGTSGITYWQGDRIVLPSLPAWVILYSYIMVQLWGALRNFIRVKRYLIFTKK